MNPEMLTSPRLRIGVLIFVVCLLYTILAIQLWTMQVLRRDEYQDRSRMQSARTIRIPPIRGRILARNGEPLADNRVSYDVKLHLAELRARNHSETLIRIRSAISEICSRTGRENTFTDAMIERHMNYFPGIPMILFRDLSPAELAVLQETHPLITGLEIAAEPVRTYPHGTFAAHLLGYVKPGDAAKAGDRSSFFYYIPDPEGREGLEKYCNESLRGTAGRRLAVVNSTGFVHEYLEEEAAIHGKDVRLTLDFKAQQCAERLLAGKVGAIVVLNANTGEILAMASSPTYKPELFYPKISHEDYQALAQNPDQVFLNRASAGSYMPGSIIKPLTALAILKHGHSPDDIFECTGRVPYGYRGAIKCMFNAVHGEINIYDALKRSCNGYFVTAGMQCGIHELSAMYVSAGIGSPTGFELFERKGILPKHSPKWTDAETAYVAFGQGKVELTPLQAAVYAAAIGNGGTRWKPFLVKNIQTQGMNKEEPISVFDAVPESKGRLDVTPEQLAVVQEGMRQVVQEKGGSGRRAQNSKVTLSGKTGTADIVTQKEKYKNAWFIGYGKDPGTGELYSIAVIIEKGESGGLTAAPVAGEFFEMWK